MQVQVILASRVKMFISYLIKFPKVSNFQNDIVQVFQHERNSAFTNLCEAIIENIHLSDSKRT